MSLTLRMAKVVVKRYLRGINMTDIGINYIDQKNALNPCFKMILFNLFIEQT